MLVTSMLISFILSSRHAESESRLQGRQECAAPFSTVNSLLQYNMVASVVNMTYKYAWQQCKEALLLSLLSPVFLLVDISLHIFQLSEKEQKTAVLEQRQRLKWEQINSVLRLSIYCVKFWNSMEKSWHHFQLVPGQDIYNVQSR